MLIVILLVVLSWATFTEASHGRDYTQWYVYRATWFLLLLGLLSVSVFAAAAVRFPWNRRQIPFLITHAGILVLLGGSITTFYFGQEGSVIIPEGQVVDQIQVNERSQFLVLWRDALGKAAATREIVSFDTGPRDWPAGHSLDLGDFGGTQIEVLKFYRHARTVESWVPDPAQAAGPVLRLAFCDANGKALREDWLVASSFAAEMELGKARLGLQRVTVDTFLDDFLKPPPLEKEKTGVLSWHYQGKTGRIPVAAGVGKKTPVGDAQVEIVKYLPNAQPDNAGKFISQGEAPTNPMLELLVHLPDTKEPVRQIAFAQAPTLNLDMLHGTRCPVKFWYHHPATNTGLGLEFLQTSQDKLYYRLLGKNGLEKSGEVKLDERIPLGPQFQVAVVKQLAHAQREITCQSVTGQDDQQEAAVLLRLSSADARSEVWLKRGDPEFGQQQYATPKGTLGIQFGYEQAPLGFALRLTAFRRGMNPGGMGDASFASSVRLIDKSRSVDEPREISMNEPLTYGRYTLYQSSFIEGDDGKYTTVLTAAYDPGLWVKYLGSLMICFGTLYMFISRAYARRETPETSG